MKTKNNTVFPQTEAIPSLAIHPSIPDDLAERMLAVADIFAKTPEAYNGFKDTCYPHPCGCIMSHVAEGIPDDVSVFSDGRASCKWPRFRNAFYDIYTKSAREENRHNPAWAIARISHFLATGE